MESESRIWSLVLAPRRPGGSQAHFINLLRRAGMLLCCVLVLVVLPLRAQNFTASVVGAVRDPSGALIPGAKVTMTNMGNGFAYSATTDSTGEYVIRNLEPATYGLRVQAQGFKTYEQTGIVLVVQLNTREDVTLEVGATIQTVEVTGTAPLLQSQDAALGQIVNQTFMLELPLVGRDAFQLIQLTPGVVPPPGTSAGVDYSGFAISNGMRFDQMDVVVDGMSESSPDFEIRQINYVPSIDAIEEFKVAQNNFTAEQGYSGSTAVNMVMRSGTNRLHGTLYEFDRNTKLDANSFFSNESGSPTPVEHWNDFGVTLGGPIQKNKTFFFADFEGSRTSSPVVEIEGLPDAAERAGNFSELCGGDGPNGPAPTGTFNSQGLCSDPNGQLWDPYSGVYSASYEGPVRGTFIPFNRLDLYQSPGNPSLAGTSLQPAARAGNLISPQAQKIMTYYPPPNYNLGPSVYNPYFNFLLSGSSPSSSNAGDIKIDRRFGDRTQVSGRFTKTESDGHVPMCYDNAWDPCSSGDNPTAGYDIQLRGTHNFGPNKLLSVTYGFSRFWFYPKGVMANFPNYNFVTDAGFPAYMGDGGFVNATPAIMVGGPYVTNYESFSIGQQGWTAGNAYRMNHDILVSMDWIKGHHDIKFGGETRIYFQNDWDPSMISGTFSFSQFGTSQYPAAGGGDAMATFLTGTQALGGENGSYSFFIAQALAQHTYSGYIQDKWRTTNKLTVNYGLRYDLELPGTDRWNRLEYFNPNISSPLQVPGWSSSYAPLMGGDVFPTSSNRGMVPNRYYRGFQPRLGVAYQLNDKTVLRAGGAIFFSYYQFGAATPDSISSLDGYTPTTPWFSTYQNAGAIPGTTLSNPWPSGLLLPTGSSLGALTNVGLAVSGGVDAKGWDNQPYLQAWNIGIQRTLPGNILLDVNYVGQKGTHLMYAGYTSFQYLGPWAEQLIGNPTTATNQELTALASYVNNPFSGIITNPSSCLSGPTIPLVNLMWPNPQFCGEDFVEPPWSNSNYNALQIRAEKRLSHGLQFLANYTWSKSLDDTSCNGDNVCWIGGFTRLEDPNNRRQLPYSQSEFNMPHVLNLSYVYHLPVGQGMHWGSGMNRWANGVLGGWETTGIWVFASGQPLSLSWISCGVPVPSYGCQQPNLIGKLQKTGGAASNWINNYFSNENTALEAPPPYALGTGPPVMSGILGPGTFNANLALFKNFPLAKVREGSSLQFRIETINGFNTPKFAQPNTTFQSPNFGIITSQLNEARQVQLGMKLYF